MTTGIRVINPCLAWKPFPHIINFIKSEGALQAANGEKQINSSVWPTNHNNGQYNKIFKMVQQWHLNHQNKQQLRNL